MDRQLKKIIVREGLILLVITIIGSVASLYTWFNKEVSWLTPLQLWRNWLLIIAVPFYAFYLLIRFIIWAVRKLKEKMR